MLRKSLSQRRNEIIYVSGQRGSGKSFWVQNFIRGLPRFMLYDMAHEYTGAPTFHDADDFLEYCAQYEQVGGFFEAIFAPDPRQIERVKQEDETEPPTDFDLFCMAALAMGNIYVIVEEIDQFTTPYATPIKFQRLVKYGRHYNVNVIGVSRRPSEVSRLFTSQATRYIVFRQWEPRDISYFQSLFGPTAQEIPRLQIYHHFDIDLSGGPSETDYEPQKIAA